MAEKCAGPEAFAALIPGCFRGHQERGRAGRSPRNRRSPGNVRDVRIAGSHPEAGPRCRPRRELRIYRPYRGPRGEAHDLIRGAAVAARMVIGAPTRSPGRRAP
jgi:hypothetical protein